MKPYRDNWTCPECDETIEVKVFPYTPAITHRSAEDCEPADGGYTDPEECPTCNCSIDYEEFDCE